MRDLTALEKYRMNNFPFGKAYKVKLNGNWWYVIVGENEDDWEHVSISPVKNKRMPNYKEMQELKELFFNDDEGVYEFHPPKKDYLNLHEYCLHLWRPKKEGMIIEPPWQH